MDAVQRAISTLSTSSDFLEAVTAFSKRAAGEVATLLNNCKFATKGAAASAPPICLDSDALLALGLALSLRRWERNGFLRCLDSDLPSSGDVLRQAFAVPPNPELGAFVYTNWWQVIAVLHDSIVWPRDGEKVQAELAMTAKVDDEFVDAMADFLWTLVTDPTKGTDDESEQDID